MKITSYGAAEEVTGSKHLFESNGGRILLDCGMFQGHRRESHARNRTFPFDAELLNAVILSHAHIDHSGLLPMLAKHGYRGNVYATPATRDLCAIMLMDSAHIQQRDAEWLTKEKMTFVPPVYGPEDVQEIMRRFISVPYELRMPILPNVYLTFHDAGHVLGSAMVELEYEEEGKQKRLIFSGDIGRKNMPILQDPWAPDNADVVIMESTYGTRDHDPVERLDEKFGAVVRETHDRGGKIIIPTFALERAQEVIYALKRLEMKNAIPPIPVFVDSPLTVNITEVFRLHTEGFDQEFQKLMRDTRDPFQLQSIEFVRDRYRSMELNKLEGPAIILAASGMCEFGRIVHHLKNHIADQRNTVLIVGYQAQNTLGRKIVERQRTVKIFGVPVELNAQVVVMNEFSAHAGRSELIEFATRFKKAEAQILLVHGESKTITELKQSLEKEGLANVSIQKDGVPFKL
jgi:metallo-beta-lactamase family protein